MPAKSSEDSKIKDENDDEKQKEKFVHPTISGSGGKCPFATAAKKSRNKGNGVDYINVGIFVSGIVLIISILASVYFQHHRPGMDFQDVWFSVKDSFSAGFKTLSNYQANANLTATLEPEPGVDYSRVRSPETVPKESVSFKVHFNGDGTTEGIEIQSSAYSSLDTVIETTCRKWIETFNDDIIKPSQCLTRNGARLYKETGVRIFSFLDIDSNHSRTYVVPQGILFVFPYVSVGNVIYPETVSEIVPGKPIKLTQLSMSPRVFSIENFMSPEEMDKIISHNEHLVKPSEVGYSGWRDSTRTSYTSWDFTSWAAKQVQRRSFDITSLPFDHRMADAVQVLRYQNTEWYKPHVDYFDSKGYDGNDPTVNNGTNRFATVFLYISAVEEGGETVFPLSTTHKGYNGEQLVAPNTNRTAGYIANKDAEYVCNSKSSALRTKPKAGDAVLFYSQTGRGELDRQSLHGGCPVIKGTKWSANVWLWNRPKPDKSKAKEEDKKRREEYLKGNKADNNQIQVDFRNGFEHNVKLYWDDGSKDLHFQKDLEVDQTTPMQTYDGHVFVVKHADTGAELFRYRATKKDNHREVKFV